MAYSRWKENECWYTFWSSNGSEDSTFKLPTKKLKNTQTFEICDYPSYGVTYGDLKKKGLKKVVKEIQEFYKDKKETELSDYTRLRWYLILFMDDIDDHFRWRNFFYYEWYIPIRNFFIWKLKKI